MSILWWFSFPLNDEIIIESYSSIVLTIIWWFVILIFLIDISDPCKVLEARSIVVVVHGSVSSQSASKLLKIDLGTASIPIEYDILDDWEIDGFIELANSDDDFAWILRITESIDGAICIIVWVIGECISRSTRIKVYGYLVRLIYRARKYDGLFELFDTCFIRNTSASDEILHEFFGISWKLHALKQFFCFTEDRFFLSIILLLLCLSYEEFEHSHLRFIWTHIRYDVIVHMWSISRCKIFWQTKCKSWFTKKFFGNITWRSG